MDGIRQLGYAGLDVSDIDAWEIFATEVLGMQATPRGTGGDAPLHLRMDEYERRVSLHPARRDDVRYLGLEVAGTAQLAAVRARLESAGRPATSATEKEAAERFAAGLVRTEDPDGLPIEVYFGPRLRVEEPFHSPRPISGFRTGDLGLGHVVLCVGDIERSVAFYRDVLGFRISDLISFEPAPGLEVSVTFLHCNPRHHSLALVQAPLPTRLNHLMVELHSLDDVGSTYDLCRDRGIPIAMDLGRHTNDRMVSFYAQSPSGFQVEYGWGGRLIDDANWRVQTHRAASIWGHRLGGEA
ncbi:MAG: VOC family protein [Acidimicrobiia bacterium]|nr:VOC family protein [Acidimicrobiia bacterium]